MFNKELKNEIKRLRERMSELTELVNPLYVANYFSGCPCCGGTKNKTIHADHIQTFSEHPELRYAIDNGRTLCAKCHYKRHWGDEVECDITL